MFEASSDIFNYCRDSLCEGGVKGVAIKTPGNVLRNLRETLEKNWRGGEGKVRGCWWRRLQTLDMVLRRRETWWDINLILIVQKCTMCQQVPIPQLTSPPSQIVKVICVNCEKYVVSSKICLKYGWNMIVIALEDGEPCTYCDSDHSWCCFLSLLVLLFITPGVAFYHSWCCFLSLLVLLFYHSWCCFFYHPCVAFYDSWCCFFYHSWCCFFDTPGVAAAQKVQFVFWRDTQCITH